MQSRLRPSEFLALNEQWNANICVLCGKYLFSELNAFILSGWAAVEPSSTRTHPSSQNWAQLFCHCSGCIFTSPLGFKRLRGLCCVLLCSFECGLAFTGAARLTSSVVIATVPNQVGPLRLNINQSKHIRRAEMVGSGARTPGGGHPQAGVARVRQTGAHTRVSAVNHNWGGSIIKFTWAEF